MGAELMKIEDAVVDGHRSTKQFVTMDVGGQLFGIPVLTVQDVLRAQRITRIPLSPPEILGSINLRGRIVTVIDMRRRLGLEPREEGAKMVLIVVEHEDEQYSFVVDHVGEVLNLSLDDFESNPPNLDERWRGVALGIYRLKDRLMVVFDIESMLSF